jgi:hypothetical protein
METQGSRLGSRDSHPERIQAIIKRRPTLPKRAPDEKII